MWRSIFLSVVWMLFCGAVGTLVGDNGLLTGISSFMGVTYIMLLGTD